ncbi:MAG TPA: ISNCY family transposase, partial [Anaerovoracaceae bacterium]|nr:ISNCY family transposase [Anaerovoracaceae bacterium]
QANEFLNSYIKEFNAKFALTIDHTKSVFEKQPPADKINLILAVLADRKVDSGHSVKFKNKYFRLLDSEGSAVYHYKGTSGIVIKSFSEELFFCIGDNVYALEEIPSHEVTSKNFDFVKPEKHPKKQYIPPMNHPWRQYEFKKFVKAQAHRADLSA